MADTEKTPKIGFFKGVQMEFKKITWLDRTSLIKQSVAVVAISVVTVAIIAIVDMGVQYGVQYLIK